MRRRYCNYTELAHSNRGKPFYVVINCHSVCRAYQRPAKIMSLDQDNSPSVTNHERSQMTPSLPIVLLTFPFRDASWRRPFDAFRGKFGHGISLVQFLRVNAIEPSILFRFRRADNFRWVTLRHNGLIGHQIAFNRRSRSSLCFVSSIRRHNVQDERMSSK